MGSTIIHATCNFPVGLSLPKIPKTRNCFTATSDPQRDIILSSFLTFHLFFLLQPVVTISWRLSNEFCWVSPTQCACRSRDLAYVCTDPKTTGAALHEYRTQCWYNLYKNPLQNCVPSPCRILADIPLVEPCGTLPVDFPY